MPSRRKSRADKRRSQTPPPGFKDRRSHIPHDLVLNVIENETNIGIVVKHEMVSDNIAPLREALRDAVDRHEVSRIVLNLEQVPYIDTAGVGLLTEVHNRLRKSARKLILVNLHPRVESFFDILNLHELFDVRKLS